MKPDNEVADEVVAAKEDFKITVFDPIIATLAEMREQVTGLRFDVTCEDGRAACEDLVKRIHKLRTRSNAMREAEVRPHLSAQRTANAIFKDKIEPECRTLAAPFEKMLKDEDDRREAVRREAEAKEAARIRGHRDRIVVVRNLPGKVIGRSAADILGMIEGLPADADDLEEFTEEMKAAVAEVRPLLRQACDAAREREMAADRQAQLEREMAQLRAQVAATPQEAPSPTPQVDPQVDARSRILARSQTLGGYVDRVRRVEAPAPVDLAAVVRRQGTVVASRPTDDEMIDVLSLHYRVHESKIIEWLLDADFATAGQRLNNLPF